MSNNRKNITKKMLAMKWAFSLAWKFNKRLLFMCYFFVSIAAILPAVAMYYNKQVIRMISMYVQTNEGSFNSILPYIMFFGVFTALVGLSGRLNEDFLYSIMFDSYYFNMEEILMDCVQSYSMKDLLQKKLNDEFNSCVMREGALTDFISGFCVLWGKMITFVALIVVAFSISQLISFISLVYVLGVIIINLFSSRKNRSVWDKISSLERISNYYENLFLTPECAKEMRIYKSQDYIIDKWRDVYKPISEYETRENITGEKRVFLSSIGYYIFLSIIIIYSIFGISNKTIAVDDLLVIFSLGLSIYSMISGVARTIVFTERGLFTLEKQYKFFRTVSISSEDNSKIIHSLNNNIVFEAKNLYFSYGDKEDVIQNVSFSIKKGEKVALIGMNGSGKTTLIKLLLGLYKPNKGKLFLNGISYERLNMEDLNNRISTFFQDFYLFHMPIYENIGFGDVAKLDQKDRIENAITKGKIRGIIDSLTHGLDTFVHKWIETDGKEFSGGESQKIAVARAYMGDTEIMIFDEPASMLDPVSELEQFVTINDTINEKTAILISHRVGFARLADRIILMDGGKIIESGTHEELIALRGAYYNMFNEQARWYREEINEAY